MTTPLQVTKLTPKQILLVAQLLTYFSTISFRALKKLEKNPEHIEPIPLTKIYQMFKCNAGDKRVVKMAAHVYFIPMFRGNFITKKCSGWAPRKELHINPQIEQIVYDAFNKNVGHMQAIDKLLTTITKTKKVLNKKENIEVDVSDYKVELKTTFKFRFDSKKQALEFKDLVLNILNQTNVEYEIS